MVATIKFSQFTAANLSNPTNTLVGVSAPSSGSNIKVPFPLIWTTAGRPSSPTTWILGANSDLGQYEFWNGAAWVQLAAGGSGSVNLGSVNQLGWYAATGSAISGLMTSNNSVLTTNNSGVPDWVTTLPSGLTLLIPIITGVTDGSNAAAGDVGEYISDSVLVGSAVSVPDNIATNVAMITLTPGDWNICGSVTSNPAGSYSSTYMAVGISIVSSTFGTVGAENNIAQLPISFTTILGTTLGVGSMRLSVTVNTPVYLITQINFSGTTMGAYGFIGARRAR